MSATLTRKLSLQNSIYIYFLTVMWRLIIDSKSIVFREVVSLQVHTLHQVVLLLIKGRWGTVSCRQINMAIFSWAAALLFAALHLWDSLLRNATLSSSKSALQVIPMGQHSHFPTRFWDPEVAVLSEWRRNVSQEAFASAVLPALPWCRISLVVWFLIEEI